ncbi:carboxy-cis,cis-muconate cyclase [Xylariaceae sp. FL0255]|nr:carboxy-cis,cis-muconate cyclase [Xylariaceae sp. FL0255]
MALTLSFLLVLLSLNIRALASVHTIIVGTFGTEFLYTVQYNDEEGTLSLVGRSSVEAASSWLTLSHDKTKMYGTNWNSETPTFISYDLSDWEDIKVEASILGGGLCSGSKSIFVNAYQEPPYTVYGNYYYGNAWCSSVMSVHENGTLDRIIQEYVYSPGSAVHGTAFSPNGEFMFSTDTLGNLIWTHRIDPKTGILSNLSKIRGPEEGSGPRHATTDYSGTHLYVVFEEASLVGQYSILENGTLVFDAQYSLLPEGADPTDYWADEVSLSPSEKYLWASNRAHNISQKGFISAFELNVDGQIQEQLFLNPTTNSGGFANSVAASPYNDSIASLTDNSTGFVEIWDITGNMLAHLDINDGEGCCANAVWLD